MEPEIIQRLKVVDEARSWVGTPYHHQGKVKGVGVDCGQLILETFFNVGLAPRFEVGDYPHDWHLHRDAERYLGYVEEHMSMVRDHGIRDRLHYTYLRPELLPKPGDVIVWKYGRTFSHGAIVTQWPYFIHAYFPVKQVLEESLIGHPLMNYHMRHYSFWEK